MADEHAQVSPAPNMADKFARAAELMAIPGHPLQTFDRENKMLEMLIAQIRGAMAEKTLTTDLFNRIRDLSVHYAKKGDLLYPHLKVKYEIAGPSDVMWTTDDEIRDEITRLGKFGNYDQEWMDAFEQTLQRVEKMIFQENRVLYPVCAVFFNEEEWHGIYHDAKDYAECFGVKPETWPDAEEAERKAEENARELVSGGQTDAIDSANPAGEIVMPGGHMTLEQLTAMLNTLPVEISFVDADNINRYFNEGPKVFKRPGMAIDREVFSCHPPKIEPMVRSIMDSFRNGTRDRVPVWMEKQGRAMLVTYMAVRDREGKYLGTVEAVQDMQDAKEHFAAVFGVNADSAGSGMPGMPGKPGGMPVNPMDLY